MSANRKYTQLDLSDIEVIAKYVSTYMPTFPGDTRKSKLCKALTEMITRVHQLGGPDNVRICLANAVRRKDS